MRINLRAIILSIIITFILMSNFLGLGINFYTDLLWFENLNFSSSFLTIFKTKVGIRLGVWALFSIIIFINLFFTKNKVINLIDNLRTKNENKENIIELNPTSSKGWLNFITKSRINLIYFVVSIFLGFLFSNIASNSWEMILKFFNSTSFGINDPIFNKDISFYVFKFPFYQFLYQLVSTLIVISGLVVGVIYLLTAKGNSLLNRIDNNTQAKYHLSILISLFFGLKAWGYRLNMFQLLYSNRGVAFGASYTDVNAQLLGLKILTTITILLAIFIFINIFIKNTKLIIGGVIALFVASILLTNIYPGIVQKYQVEPNEVAKESPYIKYNIQFTQKAYGLHKIKEKEFNFKKDLTYNDIRKNQNTIDNIRLWDDRPLKATYSQLQEIRSYYNFNDIDIDRYKLNGKLQQVMLGARELNQQSLSTRAQTWVNKKLNYTHGFGITMSPVNKATKGGLPNFIIKDIPPYSKQLKIKEPRIYYGESTNEYVIVNTKAKEFDYPQGDKNQYNNYQGDGGVKLNSSFKKLIFAIKYGTFKLLLNDDITTDSRLMFERNIKARVKKVAPFLKYDQDPYLVVGEDGKLYWIQDAYTTTSMYPYSEPISNLQGKYFNQLKRFRYWGNYIRNSVKVVTDTYTGKMKFYIVDSNEPLIQTYKKIFPNLFTSITKMPKDLKEHIRYPKDFFNVQATLYSDYHMQDPTVFYNQEDIWEIPEENYAGQSILMEPYYTLMSLPKENKNSFLLMLPFTPAKKDNLISWLAARSDSDQYGELILYKFPKGELVYGPKQIEAKIDQESEISQQLSLWDQRGSRVIRGNLLTIPINNSLLYIEPIYLQAEEGQLPELKRIIVAYGDRVVMESNLNLALQKLFNIKKERNILDDTDQITEINDDKISFKELVSDITSLYNQAQEELKQGDWAAYGQTLEKLEAKLKVLKKKTK